jgi:hypothetical protein
MGMMPLRINTFFHVSNTSFYSIFYHSVPNFQTLCQEENDQAFSNAL